MYNIYLRSEKMDIYDKLNLNEIVEIVKLIANTTDINEFEKKLYIGDIDYDIIKYDNTIIISSSEGKKLEVSLESKKVKKIIQNRDITYLNNYVNVKYKLNDNEKLNLISKISLDDNFDVFKYIERDNLYENYLFNYLNDDVVKACMSIDLSTIRLDKYKVYDFYGDSVIEGNKEISLNNDKLIKLSGRNIPNMDVINSFDLNNEKQKLNDFLEKKDIHPFTKELVEEIDKLLDIKQKFVEDVKNFYKYDIKEFEKVKLINKSITSGINKNFFTKDELSLIIDSVGYYLDNNDSKKLELNKSIH